MLIPLIVMLMAALAVLAAPLLFIFNGDDLAPWLVPFRPIRRIWSRAIGPSALLRASPSYLG